MKKVMIALFAFLMINSTKSFSQMTTDKLLNDKDFKEYILSFTKLAKDVNENLTKTKSVRPLHSLKKQNKAT
jgi:hypothetical protein